MKGSEIPSVGIRSVVFERRAKSLVLPIQSLDHSDHVVRTALLGHPQLAADHLLNREMVGRLSMVIGNVIRQLNLEFRRSKTDFTDCEEVQKGKIKIRQLAYEVLIEIALNLAGVESKVVGFAEEEVSLALQHIINIVERWETLESLEGRGAEETVAKAVVDRLLSDIKKVSSGYSMVSKIAEEIEAVLKIGNPASSFIVNSMRSIRENVYYKMSVEGLCKFGNDYALGLRWLRHLGFVQVSTNPVLAARAYEDDPDLWGVFSEVVREHPEWAGEPELFSDEIAMEATMVALWPNLTILRPIALLSEFNDGLVSYQLNPNVARSLKGSLSDALRIYSSAREFLRRYDAYLTWGYSKSEWCGRPNVVFKVACENPVAAEITTALNEMGVGTNNTVTFSVTQEVTLIMAAMRGMAVANQVGIPVTKVYETNMGGRLESHLREVEAERLLKDALKGEGKRGEILSELAFKLGALDEFKAATPFDERVRILCSSKYLKKLTDEPFLEALVATGDSTHKDQLLESLRQLEEAIGLAGTLVARRVYRIFFSPENRVKWIEYLKREFALSTDDADDILCKIDLLPASKRKPEDTLLTLSRRNLTNTEFPNHQLNVLLRSRQEDFSLEYFEDSINREPDSKVLQRLLEIVDFRKAYELTPKLVAELKRIGVEGDFGDYGLEPGEWSAFGPVVKTMSEFRSAYEKFKEAVVEFVRKSYEHRVNTKDTLSRSDAKSTSPQ